ncbi:DUF2911 domain-containing protein [Panacibacter ginsenosidivorans]|uniref:DUF2911 domain-containing protein n=1 Tax=Panacibacter ginsenosidivorans TaxID=1813871 RepID=A0A5B8VAS9_9BACT|nr:DUF2911 domain-containing protein [Panacibacter ginsenosidivorans]QEC68235.1 DUF2911 domain-containing protein [Panacibacter ginsenosidivorans]
MKNIVAVVFLFISFSSFAQVQPTDLDKSPMDMNYSPQGYPILKMNGKTTVQPNCRIVYSRPQKAGRDIFGGIISYGQVWRLGANEATEIEFFKNVKIDGKTIPKGKYTMYAICNQTKWTIIFNSEKDVWGLYYNPKKDVLRTDVDVMMGTKVIEAFTMYFEDVKDGTNLVIMWDTIKVTVPIRF